MSSVLCVITYAMSNPKYNNTQPFAQERNNNVNFNYVWDQPTLNWIPEQTSSISSQYILANAKSFINKFGSNPDINQSVSITSPETIWDGSSEYLFPPDTSTSIQMVSSSNNDSQEIVIQGLDADFKEQSWSGNLNGNTFVQVPSPYKWTRIFRVYNNGSTDLEGDVEISQAGVPSNIYAKILNGNNQTLMSVYTIPADYTGYLTKYQTTAHNSQSSSEIGYTIHMKTRELGKVFRVKSITSAGTSHEVTKKFDFPNLLPPKTDIIFNAVSANGNNGSVDVEFNIALL